MFDDTKSETDDGGIVRARHDRESAESLSVTIMEAVARAEGTEMGDLEHRLFDVVDPDALDRLFEPTAQTTHEAEVRFVIEGNAVVIQNTGDVFVRPLE